MVLFILFTLKSDSKNISGVYNQLPKMISFDYKEFFKSNNSSSKNVKKRIFIDEEISKNYLNDSSKRLLEHMELKSPNFKNELLKDVSYKIPKISYKFRSK